MEFKDYKIEDFINDLSSPLPSPGGGSVAGLVGALSGSLNSMVYSLTVNKKSFEKKDLETQKLVLDFKEASAKFTKKALMLMEEDRKEFNKLMDCYKLPKETEEEKEFRNKEIKQRTVKAMMAPKKLAEECYKFYDNIDAAVEYGNKMLVSDAVCAAILLNAAVESAIVNVKINLNSLKDLPIAKEIEKEMKELEENSLKRKEKICSAMNN
ncbi:MAG: cyclodeaminase/cyclohydrolase family protein [Clostridium sp.]|jgi:formiminotetrahydrofolate cyclodeaminase|nr:cyclodeaminase/cyclohydrolase family protein [Clostridium sp.]